jgi:TrmH family RNA methyltransferase
MISKKEIKYLASLKQKKFRILHNEFVIEGGKLILDALKHNQPIKRIVYSTKIEDFDKIRAQSKKSNIELSLCTVKDAERISDTKNSQQIFALLKYDSLITTKNSLNNLIGAVIIIDGISDPGNVGTILRSCSWFGCYTIMITKNSVELYNPKTIRSAMGAHFHMKNIYRDTIENIVKYLNNNNYEILGANMCGTDFTKYKIKSDNWALVLGNEARGLSEEVKKIAHPVYIPGDGKMESLNVAEAGSIIMHHLFKK